MDENLKCRLREFIKQRPMCTFAEIGGAFGRGDHIMYYGDKEKNLVLWDGLPREIAEVLQELIEENKIVMRVVDSAVYILDGAYLKLPVAKSIRPYKKPHWLPVAFWIKGVIK